MANHKSAIKRIRSNKDKTLRNRYQHKSARTAIQKLRETSDKKEASSLLVFVSSIPPANIEDSLRLLTQSIRKTITETNYNT